MAGEVNLKRGAKILMAYEVPIGSQPKFDMMVSFAKNLDESVFLVSVPMDSDGQPIPIDENRKLLMRYGGGTVQSLIAGYADDLVTEGIRSYWKIRRVTEYRQYIKRVDERVKAQFSIDYTQETWAQNPDGTTVRDEAYTLDISYGGAAVYMHRRFRVGETVELFFPGMGNGPGSDPLSYVIGGVCWVREAPQGSPYKNICGLQYRFEDGVERERMKMYVENVRRLFKL